MHAHGLQHVPFEGLGSIEPWLISAGYRITNTRFFHTTELPRPQEIDLLVVMGGPMSVNDEREFPWLAQEKRFIRSAIDLGKPVLGICLGAQLIATRWGRRYIRIPSRRSAGIQSKALQRRADGLSASRRRWRFSTGTARLLTFRPGPSAWREVKAVKTRRFSSAGWLSVYSFIWRPHLRRRERWSRTDAQNWCRRGLCSLRRPFSPPPLRNTAKSTA